MALLGHKVDATGRVCAQCGEPLVRARKGTTLCRLCATRSAYAYLARSVTERRGRGKVPAGPAA